MSLYLSFRLAVNEITTKQCGINQNTTQMRLRIQKKNKSGLLKTDNATPLVTNMVKYLPSNLRRKQKRKTYPKKIPRLKYTLNKQFHTVQTLDKSILL